MSNVIDSFRNEYYFLSNFYPSESRLGLDVFQTLEHAFQAAKTLDSHERKTFQMLDTADKAKRYGRHVKLRLDWDQIKYSVMLYLVRQKFTGTNLEDKLIATGDKTLIEGNTWNDTYWGVCDGNGLNYLGIILMQVRHEVNLWRTIING